MDKAEFIAKIGKFFDIDCSYQGTGHRLFTEMEKSTFLSHLWDFCEPTLDNGTDYQSPIFILALQRVAKKYRSIQDQAANLQAAIDEEIALAKARQKSSINMP